MGPIPFATMVNRECAIRAELLEVPAGAGLSGISYYGLRRHLCGAGAEYRCGEDTSIILYMCSAPCGSFQFHILSMLLLRLRRGKKILHIPTYGSIVLFFPLGLL